jgi:hypothetical protein
LTEKTKRKNSMVVLTIIALIAIAGIGYSLYTHYQPSTSAVTKLKSSNTNGPATSNNPNGASSAGTTATVYQAIFITDSDGGTYWVYPPSEFQAMSILGYGQPNNETFAVNEWNQIANIQSFIYFTPTLTDNSGVSKWTFTCFATIAIMGTYTSTGAVDNTTYGYLAQNTPIAYTSTSLTSGQLTYVISAGSANGGTNNNGVAIGNLIAGISGVQQTGEYKYVETLTDVGLTINFNDGATSVLTASSGAQNQLTWLIKFN